MTWLALRLFGIGKALGNLWEWATASTARMLAIALVASLAANWWLWGGWNDERAGRKADRAAYVQAQAKSVAQHSADVANVTAQTARNEKLETTHAATEIAVRDALADYKRDHRLQCPAQGATRSAAQAGLHPDPAVSVDSPAGSELLTITSADLDAFAARSLRASECTGFLNTLIAEGSAVKAD
jgi:hypothetical protein